MREAIRIATAAANPAPAGTAPRPPAATAPPPPPPRSAYPAYASVPVQTAPFCRWVRYDVPYGASVDNVRVVGTTGRDTPRAIEVRPMEAGTRSTGKGFDFHCKAENGTAVILFEVVAGDVRRYKLRVGCTAE